MPKIYAAQPILTARILAKSRTSGKTLMGKMNINQP